jgi:hypothetical protein
LELVKEAAARRIAALAERLHGASDLLQVTLTLTITLTLTLTLNQRLHGASDLLQVLPVRVRVRVRERLHGASDLLQVVAALGAPAVAPIDKEQ